MQVEGKLYIASEEDFNTIKEHFKPHLQKVITQKNNFFDGPAGPLARLNAVCRLRTESTENVVLEENAKKNKSFLKGAAVTESHDSATISIKERVAPNDPGVNEGASVRLLCSETIGYTKALDYFNDLRCLLPPGGKVERNLMQCLEQAAVLEREDQDDDAAHPSDQAVSHSQAGRSQSVAQQIIAQGQKTAPATQRSQPMVRGRSQSLAASEARIARQLSQNATHTPIDEITPPEEVAVTPVAAAKPMAAPAKDPNDRSQVSLPRLADGEYPRSGSQSRQAMPNFGSMPFGQSETDLKESEHLITCPISDLTSIGGFDNVRAVYNWPGGDRIQEGGLQFHLDRTEYPGGIVRFELEIPNVKVPVQDVLEEMKVEVLEKVVLKKVEGAKQKERVSLATQSKFETLLTTLHDARIKKDIKGDQKMQCDVKIELLNAASYFKFASYMESGRKQQGEGNKKQRFNVFPTATTTPLLLSVLDEDDGSFSQTMPSSTSQLLRIDHQHNAFFDDGNNTLGKEGLYFRTRISRSIEINTVPRTDNDVVHEVVKGGKKSGATKAKRSRSITNTANNDASLSASNVACNGGTKRQGTDPALSPSAAPAGNISRVGATPPATPPRSTAQTRASAMNVMTSGSRVANDSFASKAPVASVPPPSPLPRTTLGMSESPSEASVSGSQAGSVGFLQHPKNAKCFAVLKRFRGSVDEGAMTTWSQEEELPSFLVEHIHQGKGDALMRYVPSHLGHTLAWEFGVRQLIPLGSFDTERRVYLWGGSERQQAGGLKLHLDLTTYPFPSQAPSVNEEIVNLTPAATSPTTVRFEIEVSNVVVPVSDVIQELVGTLKSLGVSYRLCEKSKFDIFREGLSEAFGCEPIR